MKRILLAATVLMAAGIAAKAGEPRELSLLRERYESQADTALSPLLQNYIRELEGVLKRTTTLKDFEAAKAVQDELDRQKARLAGLSQEALLGRPEKAAKTENLLKNGGFEKGDVGWLLWGHDPKRTKAERLAASAHTGDTALCFKRDDLQETGVILQDIFSEVRPGDRIYAEVWVKRAAKAKGDVLVGMVLKDVTDKKIIQVLTWPARPTGKWERMAFDFVVPAKEQTPDLGKVQIVVLTQGKGATDEVWVDDFYAGTAPPPAP